MVNYLYEFGIDYCYVSPLTVARADSMHAYDATDHSRVNPELGGEEQFLAFARALSKRVMD